jgi:hypothetical protein
MILTAVAYYINQNMAIPRRQGIELYVSNAAVCLTLQGIVL